MAEEIDHETELHEEMESNTKAPPVLVLEDNKNLPENFNSQVAIVRIWTSTANYELPGEYVGHVSLELILDEKRGSWNEMTYISVGPDTLDYDNLMRKPFHQYHVKYVNNYSEDLESEGRAPECTFVFYSLDVEAMKVAIEKLLVKYPLSDQRWTVAGPSFSLGESKMSYWDILSDMFQQYIGKYLSSSSGKCLLQNSTEKENSLASHSADTENGTVKNVSCVSLAFEILNQGFLSTKLLTNKAGQKSLLNASDESSNQSVKGVLNKEYVRILRAAGYVLEFGLASFILSPDVFVDLLKAAKKKELIEEGPPPFTLKFVNNNINEIGHCEATEEIPSLEEKKKLPYHFMAFVTIAVIIFSVVMYRSS